MWAIYHHWACLCSPHWAIGVGWLSRILIAGSTSNPHQCLKTRGTRWESEITSQPSLCRPFPFSRHRFTSAQHVVTRRNTCGMVGKAQTHIGCWISERKQEESVRPMAGLRVDYRTPEEIFLSPETVVGRGLTTAEPQNKHLQCSCKIHKEMDTPRSSSLHHKAKCKTTGSLPPVFMPNGVNHHLVEDVRFKCVSTGEIRAAVNAWHLLPTSPGYFFTAFGKKNPRGVFLLL